MKPFYNINRIVHCSLSLFILALKCNCSDFLGYLFYCLNMIA